MNHWLVFVLLFYLYDFCKAANAPNVECSKFIFVKESKSVKILSPNKPCFQNWDYLRLTISKKAAFKNSTRVNAQHAAAATVNSPKTSSVENQQVELKQTLQYTNYNTQLLQNHSGNIKYFVLFSLDNISEEEGLMLEANFQFFRKTNGCDVQIFACVTLHTENHLLSKLSVPKDKDSTCNLKNNNLYKTYFHWEPLID